MKKNPLEEIYESKVLLGEAKDNVVKGSKELDSKIGKASTVSGQGPEACKKDLDTPEEMEGTNVYAGEPKVLKDSMENEETKSYEGAFEKLFKATITEEFDNDEMSDEMPDDMDVDVPTSNEDMVDELEDDKDEVSDLVSDLKEVMSHLQTILDKISDETGPGPESNENEIEFGRDEMESDDEPSESPFKESTELKPLGDKGKVLMGKNNKVGGHPKTHGGKAHGGDVDSDPKLKPAKAYDKSLQNPKGKPEVKSTIKKGDFFK